MRPSGGSGPPRLLAAAARSTRRPTATGAPRASRRWCSSEDASCTSWPARAGRSRSSPRPPSTRTAGPQGWRRLTALARPASWRRRRARRAESTLTCSPSTAQARRSATRSRLVPPRELASAPTRAATSLPCAGLLQSPGGATLREPLGRSGPWRPHWRRVRWLSTRPSDSATSTRTSRGRSRGRPRTECRGSRRRGWAVARGTAPGRAPLACPASTRTPSSTTQTVGRYRATRPRSAPGTRALRRCRSCELGGGRSLPRTRCCAGCASRAASRSRSRAGRRPLRC